MRRGRTFPIACSCVGLALMAAPSTVTALRTYEDSIQTFASGMEYGSVTCPRGTRAVSGGFVGSPGDFALRSMRMRDDVWSVKGQFDLPATVYADCSARLEPERARVTKDLTGIRTSGTAKCRHGEAIGGGWNVRRIGPPTPNATVFASRPSLDRWRISAFNAGADAELQAFVYCLRKEVDVQRATSPLPPMASTSTSASCDDGATLLGGGFETLPKPDFFGAMGPNPRIYSLGRTDRAEWTVEGVNDSSIGGSLEAFALCLP